MAAHAPQQQPGSLEIHDTKPISHPDDSASSMHSHKENCPHKRRRDQSTCEDSEEQPSAKKRKAASHNYPPEFWNALSKITLTRKALKEFDRRSTQRKTTQINGVAKRPTRLLRSDTKKLLHFAKNGGPNLDQLRGYAELQRPPRKMSKLSTLKLKRTRDSGLASYNPTPWTTTTGPYDPQFQQMLIDNGVYPKGYRMVDGSKPTKPNNFNSIMDRLQRERLSMSPSQFSEAAFEEFQDKNDQATSESKVMSNVVPVITGAEVHYGETEDNKLFTSMETFAPGLRMAQPDKYHGARPEQVDARVRRDLDKYIIPTSNTSLPVVPNFFFEAKCGTGRHDVLQRQVMNDSAYGARAMFQLQNYGKETPEYDGNAYTIGSSYHSGAGFLQIYSTHPKQSATGDTEYYMTQLNTYGMTGNIETFRQGVAAYRNARDLSKEQRDKFIARANTLAQNLPATATPSSRNGSVVANPIAAGGGSSEPDASTDEPAPQCDHPAKRRKCRQPAPEPAAETAAEPGAEPGLLINRRHLAQDMGFVRPSATNESETDQEPDIPDL